MKIEKEYSRILYEYGELRGKVEALRGTVEFFEKDNQKRGYNNRPFDTKMVRALFGWPIPLEEDDE